MKFSAGATQTTAKTAARGPTIVAGANDACAIMEVGIESTTAVSSQVALRFITAAGTPGTDVVEVPWGAQRRHSIGDAGALDRPHVRVRPHPAGAPTGRDRRRHHLDVRPQGGLVLPEGTGNGLCLTLPGGSDAIINFYFDWEE